PFDLQPDAGQGRRDLIERRGCFQVVFKPGEGELHFVSPKALTFPPSPPSCPGLTRVSTSWMRWRLGERVDARVKPGHDDIRRVCIILPRQPEPEARLVEEGEAVVAEPAQVRVEEGAQVRDAVFQHRDALDPHAEGEALIAG